MSGDPQGLYDYRPGDGDNLLLQKILRAAAALPAAIAAAGIPEAPIDGQPYARMNAGWVVAAGGVSVIAGVVDVHGDLPVTVGSPVVNSAYLVRESSGAWLPFYDTRKAGGIWVRQFNNGNLDDWVYSGELQATQNASNFTVYDPTDPTKEIGFNAAGITAGARRILTPLNKNYTVEETGHKAKHENGGSDEISVAGLSGVLADPQPPIIGALATQAVAGDDARLTDARTPTAHKTSHENGGTDEISVAGLSGVLADPQPPIIGATGTTAVAGNDARLTDERVPTAAGLTTKFGTNKATVVDGDKIGMLNSAASDAPVHILWSLVKSTLKTYFDTIYTTAAAAIAAVKAGFVLDENASIDLDAALSADGKYCGICEDGTAGAALAFGDLCYFAVADSRWELTDADAAATAGPVKLGMCVLAAAGDGSVTKMLLFGKIRADSVFPTLTIGAPVYVGLTAGDVAVTETWGTDDVIRVIGHANTADELFFHPSNDYITYV